MTTDTLTEQLFSFICASPTPFHAADQVARSLQHLGFTLLNEDQPWQLRAGGSYVVLRNGAVIAFTIGSRGAVAEGFRIIGAHTDSPGLQLKPRSRSSTSRYFQFGVEKYGGPLLTTWFDRELSLAGRVTVLTGSGEVCSCLVDFREPVLYIPSLAIHLDRKANEGREINAQTDLSPVFAQQPCTESQWHKLLIEQVARRHDTIDSSSVLGYDLFCYDPSPPRYLGLNREFVCAPRLDNLLSCWIGLQAVGQRQADSNCMLIFTNHEEVGSVSNSGASGNFAPALIARICGTAETAAICLSRSFFVSLDNAHATHPNFPEKSDNDHLINLNQGPVIKLNSNQRYCSNSRSAALFRLLCRECGVEAQEFVMRSDMACGSTIGPLTSSALGVEGIDVGVPTWAMHSVREVTGAKDPELLLRVVGHFFARENLPVIPNR